MQYKDYREKRELCTTAIHALAHVTKYKGSNKSKQWITDVSIRFIVVRILWNIATTA